MTKEAFVSSLDQAHLEAGLSEVSIRMRHSNIL